eukprot:COSAG05_NODE_784_length_7362_cov_36.913810_3_plen_224_part_00
MKIFLDTGATHCITTRAYAQKTGLLSRMDASEACTVGLANGSKAKCFGAAHNIEFTHNKITHVIPKAYIMDSLFDGIDFLLGNNFMVPNKVHVLTHLGIAMGVQPSGTTFMLGYRRTTPPAIKQFDAYKSHLQPVEPEQDTSADKPKAKPKAKPAKQGTNKKVRAPKPSANATLPRACTRNAVPGHVYKLPGVTRLFGMDPTLVEGKTDIHREPVKGTRSVTL